MKWAIPYLAECVAGAVRTRVWDAARSSRERQDAVRVVRGRAWNGAPAAESYALGSWRPQQKIPRSQPAAKQAASLRVTPSNALAGPSRQAHRQSKGADLFTVAQAMSDILELGKKAAPRSRRAPPLVPDKSRAERVCARNVGRARRRAGRAPRPIMLVASTGKGGAAKWSPRRPLALPPALAAHRSPARRSARASRWFGRTALGWPAARSIIRDEIDIETVLPLLADPDEGVRKAAIHAIHNLVAPFAPAKPTVKLTPALHARVSALCDDPSEAVADRAQRFVRELSPLLTAPKRTRS